MKKIIVLLAISSLFSTSCSVITWDYEEPILFLDTHNSSVWERTNDSGQKSYLRILNDPKKIAKIYIGSTDRNCFTTEFAQKVNDRTIDEDSVSRLSISGNTVVGGNLAHFSLSIIDGELHEWYYWEVVHNTGGHTRVWVKSETSVEDLKRCN